MSDELGKAIEDLVNRQRSPIAQHRAEQMAKIDDMSKTHVRVVDEDGNEKWVLMEKG